MYEIFFAIPVIGIILLLLLIAVGGKGNVNSLITQLAAPVLSGVYDGSEITLTWTPVVGATGYVVEQDGLDVAIVTDPDYDVNSLLFLTYTFRVRAFRPVNVFSPYSNAVSITVPEIYATIEYQSGNNYNLSYVDSQPTGDGYLIFWRLSAGPGPWIGIGFSFASSDVLFIPVPYFVGYDFRIERQSLPVANSNIVSVLHLPTTAPGLPALIVSNDLLDPNTAITLSWNSDPEAQTWETEYSLNGTTWIPLQTFPGPITIYSHVGLTQNTVYFYRLRGINNLGPGPWFQANISTTNGIPRTPLLLSAVPTFGIVTLTIEDRAGNEDAYLIFRSDINLPGPAQIIATLPSAPGQGTQFTYQDLTVYPGIFQYFVVAQNMFTGNSFQSNTLQVTVTQAFSSPAVLTVVPGSPPQTNLNASWLPVYGANFLRLTWATGLGGTIVLPANAISFTIIELSPSIQYQVLLEAINGAGTQSDTKFMWTLPPTFDGLQVQGITDSSAAILWWNDSAGSVETSIDILRRIQGPGPFLVLQTRGPTSGSPVLNDVFIFFVDNTAIGGLNYDYKIRYINPMPFGVGESNVAAFASPIPTTVGPTYLNSFNLVSFATFFTASVSVSNNTVGYYLASYFNTTQLTLSAVSIFANLTPTPSTGSFTYGHVIEYCRRASISAPWFVDTVLSSVAPFTGVPRKIFSIPGPVGTTTAGNLATGVLVTFTGFTPLAIPSGTDFCIRVKVISYTTAPVFPALATVPTDIATKIRLWEAVATPPYTFNGTARNLGPFLASTGGQLGLIVDSPGPVVPLLTSDGFTTPAPVPQIVMEFTSP